VIAEIEKNPTQKIRVSVEIYKEHRYIDVRVFFRDEDGEWHPTKAGVTLNDETIGPVVDALKKASRLLEGGKV
jgi:hypothetical protein